MKKLKRTTFATSRLLEFFNEKELDMQLGQSRDYWPIAILKELLDNALDASEKTGPPVIKVDYGKDWVSVEDSGPGMSTELISKALDYTVRVSDKNHYIAPSRGQLGNALKCVWAAPFVWAGDGLVEIESKGVHNRIEIKVDKIAQEPKISHTTDDSIVKKGTFFKIHWPEITSYLEGEKNGLFYKWLSAKALIKRYSAFNPHATFHFKDEVFESGNREWIKFKADDQTSAYWYSPDELKGLISAYITNGGKTVREFVSEFRGLSGTGKQKAVLQDTGMSGLQLSELVNGDDVDIEKVKVLLDSMKAQSKPVNPKKLGILGKDFITRWLEDYSCEGITYKCVPNNDECFVVEMGFGVFTNKEKRREVLVGLNWSAAIGQPLEELYGQFNQSLLDDADPVCILIHIINPKLKFTDRGKSRVSA